MKQFIKERVETLQGSQFTISEFSKICERLKNQYSDDAIVSIYNFQINIYNARLETEFEYQKRLRHEKHIAAKEALKKAKYNKIAAEKVYNRKINDYNNMIANLPNVNHLI